jgi:hypothetical protein
VGQTGPPGTSLFGRCQGAKENLILNHCYAIPSGAQLTVQFVAFNPSIEGQPLQKLVSNVAHLRGIR